MRALVFGFTPLHLTCFKFRHTLDILCRARAGNQAFRGKRSIWSLPACSWLPFRDGGVPSGFHRCRERSNCGGNCIRLPKVQRASRGNHLRLGHAENPSAHEAKALFCNCRGASAHSHFPPSRRPKPSSSSQVPAAQCSSSRQNPDAMRQSSHAWLASSRSVCETA